MREEKGDVYPCMGCRSFLTPDPVNHKYYGRFNIGVSTVNLPYIALEAKKYAEDRFDAPVLEHQYESCFFETLNKYLEFCHKAQKIRLQRLENVTSDVAPILWQHGAFARLNEGESLHKLLHNNYCTSSIGYGGLYETVKILTGESHTERGTRGYDMGIKIMKYLNDTCAKWRTEENISYSLYGTPIESTTYKFAKALKRDFGIIKGITDKNYITNSYHVTPSEEISAFDKIDIESDFQKLSPGGAISYIEVGNLQNNVPAVLEIIKYIYNKIMYCELNTKSDYCYECGYDGEITLKKNDDGVFYWECPCCGNTNEDKMAVTRRVCGYLGTNGYNQGRMNDIADRYIHLQ
jgi:ribonucleoside-triphosphate reductase